MKQVRRNNIIENVLPWALIIIVAIGTMLIRLRLLGTPLERDEGEYAYMAQLILSGIPPYLKAYSMKFPGIYFVYAIIMSVFGQTTEGIHLGLTLTNVAVIILLFLVAKHLFKPPVAAVASVSFALLALGESVLGLTANAEQFLLLPMLAGFLIMLQAVDSGKKIALFLSGLCFGLAFIIKQPGIFFGISAAVYIFWYSGRIKRVLLFLTGLIMPFIIMCLYLYAAKALSIFWFWTFIYARVYVSSATLLQSLIGFCLKTPNAIKSSWILWIIAVIGFANLLRIKTEPKKRVFLLLFSIASILSILPGSHFRQHYYILILPAASLLIGSAMDGAKQFLPKLRFLLFIIVFCYSIFQGSPFFFKTTPAEACRTMYGMNPFPEAVELAKYINEHSSKDLTIAVLGSEPEIYFYLKKNSSIPYVYMYPLMEAHPYAMDMQNDLINAMELNPPEYLVFVNIVASWTEWYVSDKLQKHMFGWFEKFKDTYYEIVGVIDIMPGKNTEYRWGYKAQMYEPKSNSFIYIFKKH